MLFGLAAVALLAWIHLVRMAAMDAASADKAMHAAMGMPEMAAWGTTRYPPVKSLGSA